MSKRPKNKFKTYENGIMMMMFFTFGIVFLDRFSINYLFPIFQKQLGLSNGDLGLLISVLSICFAISGWVFGVASDLSGLKKKILVPVTFIFSICSFLTGLASSLASMMVVRGLMGVIEGPVFPVGQSVLAKESTPARRGFNLGFAQSAVGLIGACITPLVVTAIAASSNWRIAFYVAGIPGILMSLILLKFMKNPFRSRVGDETNVRTKATLKDYKAMLKYRNVWLAMLITALFMAWLVVFTAFMPGYLMNGLHFNAVQMGYVMSAIGFGSFLWGFIVPWASDKIGRKPALVIFGVLACLSPIVYAVAHVGIGLMIVIGIVTAVGQGCIPLIEIIVPSEAVPPVLASTVIAVMQLVGELIGGTVIPSIAGFAADKYGLTAPLWIAAGSSLLAVFVAIALRESAPRKMGEHKRVDMVDALSTSLEN